VAAAPRVTVGVRREAVLAGGALGSAKVLMLSGVGPADVLGNASVPLRRALPGVGQNLQDHLVSLFSVIYLVFLSVADLFLLVSLLEF
jgi:choline dehydrogenase-like flavoprotein